MTFQAKASSQPLARPWDVETEQALLGTLLIDNGSLTSVATFLKPEHFYEPLHQRIFECIARLVKIGQVASPITLRPHFALDAGAGQVGGPRYLAELCRFTPTTENAIDYARIVFELAMRRALIEAAEEISATALDPPIDMTTADQLAVAEQALARITANMERGRAQQFRSLGSIAAEVVDRVSAGDSGPCVKYGILGLDNLTGGMRPGEYVVIGARPGMGKTAVAGKLALEAGAQRKGVAFFSMEMGAEAIALRLLTAIAEAHQFGSVPYEGVRKGEVTDAKKLEALIRAEGILNGLPVWIHEGRGHTPSQIMLEAKRLARAAERRGTPLGLVVVDHLQKIKPERDMRGNKVAEMTESSDMLQKMAGILGVPVVALSQLNRAVEGRSDKRPELSDLRESGAIEQDADCVLLLYREAYYLKKREPAAYSQEHGEWYAEYSRCRNVLEIQVAKQRNGPEGLVQVHFDAPTSAIKN